MTAVNLRKQPYTVYGGRGRNGVLGNPFSHLEDSLAQFPCRTRAEAIERHRDWLLSRPGYEDVLPKQRREVWQVLRGLKEDDVLGCFCLPLPCHCTTLVWLAEGMRNPGSFDDLE